MAKYESTETLMQRLKDGSYKRVVMENDGEEDSLRFCGAAAVDSYKRRISCPNNYDHIAKRSAVKGEGLIPSIGGIFLKNFAHSTI